MKFGFLSGGTGTPKLLQGFRNLVTDDQLAVICNGGDDYLWHGLRVCPDLDTVLYLFSGRLDTKKFWGVNDESFNALETLKSLGIDEWFNIGDKDLGLHIYRQEKLENNTLTSITEEICKKWKIEAQIAPMTDNHVQSYIYAQDTKYHFQEYFIKHRWSLDVSTVKFEGNTDTASQKALHILDGVEKVIIGPSNPITSIGPILAIKPLAQKLMKHRSKTIAVSPIIGTSAFSGPSTRLMEAMKVKPNPLALAKHYKNIISKLILDSSDREYEKEIEDLEIEPIFLPIELKTRKQKQDLARSIIELM